MNKLTITYIDNVRCLVKGLTEEDNNALYKEFSIFIPSARFMPKYKMGLFDGYIRYFQKTGQTYINLIPLLLQKINVRNYVSAEEIYMDDYNKDIDLGDSVDKNFLSHINWYKGHRFEGLPIELGEHQVRAINHLLKNHRSVLCSSTSSGKTLICGALCHKIKEHGKTVIVVPSKDLCRQTATELTAFGLDVGIVGMGLREFDHNVIVCTWQTINSIEKTKKKDSDEKKLNYEELCQLKKNVVCLIFDECHQATGNHIKGVMETTFKSVPIRWGLTGTVPKAKADAYCLLTAIGPTLSDKIEAKELQDKGFLSHCKVNCIQLEDTNRFLSYDDEVDYLYSDEDRLLFISNLVSEVVKKNNNTLILVGRIETGRKIEGMMIKNNINAIFLNGSTKSKKRFEEYESIKSENNKCLICTAQIASTGLNIPRLFNIVLLDIGKSFTRCIQSIGRGLRKAKDKDFVSIYDVSSTTKYSKKHLTERIKYYKEAQYPYTIYKIEKKAWKK